MFPIPQKLGKAHFGVSTFFASAHPSESCGSNGLPLTPNSIRIIGKAPALCKINHPHLCSYVDVFRGKHERIVVVQEYYLLSLRQACEKYKYLQEESSLTKFTFQILQSLTYLHNFGTVCATLNPEHILITPERNAKLYQYGLYHLTDGGSSTSFPIGIPKYSPPEYLASYFGCEGQSNISGTCGSQLWDSWALGLIILELLLDVIFFENLGVEETIEQILSMSIDNENIVDSLVEKHNCELQFKGIGIQMLNFLKICLTVDPADRQTPTKLLEHELFDSFTINHKSLCPVTPHFPVIDSSVCLVDFCQYKASLGINEERYKDALADYPHGEEDLEEHKGSNGKSKWKFKDIDHLAERNIHEVYHLWQLVGGNVEQELKKQKLIRNQPSILNLPNIMINEGEIFGGAFMRQDRLPSSTIILPLQNLRKKLQHIPVHKYYPLITRGENNTDDLESRKLPLVIREKDAEYQFHRLVVFERLLKAYPYKLDTIVKEARKDIPPFYRAFIWASLLRVDGNIEETYEEIDKDTPTSTDRQIEVDIPRCHQYDELLSSPQGHAKFARILKAWVVSHPHLVYWQGLDSLCAPFLYLNFQNEALAYSCLSAFINKYLRNFFLRDNSAVIQEYLAKFSHLIAFHEPQLFNHLHSIGFIPELYAIPWFLTMFTHVFPLHKIFLLWDTLLLGGSSLPLCVGVGLMRQLKDRLLQFGFNECILLFSDMPDIYMEQAVQDAVEIFCSTPASITYRHYDGTHSQKAHESSNDAELRMSKIEISDLKNEMCGRMSGAELLELMSQRRNKGTSKTLILDVRPPDEFAKGTLTGALSLPADLAITNEGELSPSTIEDIAASCKGKVVVVIGSSAAHEQVVKVGNALLQNGFPRVCTLHKGIEIFRSSGHILVPLGS